MTTTAEEWNRDHPSVCQIVRYHPVLDPDGSTPRPDPSSYLTMTRSSAWMLPDGTAVVLIGGRTGGVSVHHLEVIAEGSLEEASLEEASSEARRHQAALEYICDTVSAVGLDGKSAEDLQGILTEVHCTCMLAHPTRDPDRPEYAGVRELPPLSPALEEAARLLRHARSFLPDPLYREVQEWMVLVGSSEASSC